MRNGCTSASDVLVEVEDEVVADVRVLHVEQQPVADHPLVAELVGRASDRSSSPTGRKRSTPRPGGPSIRSACVSLALRALRTFFEKRL